MRSGSRCMWFGVGLSVLLLVACTQEDTSKFIDAFAKVCGGESVVVGTSDSTAPSVWLSFPDPATGKTVLLKSGGANMRIPVKVSHAVPIWAFAEDPEGVQQIIVVPTTSNRGCQSNTPPPPGEPAIGTTDSVLYPSDPEMFSTKVTTQAIPGEMATKRLCFLYQANNQDPCEKGSHTVGYEIYVYAQGKNFSGLVTRTPMVTFVVMP